MDIYTYSMYCCGGNVYTKAYKICNVTVTDFGWINENGVRYYKTARFTKTQKGAFIVEVSSDTPIPDVVKILSDTMAGGLKTDQLFYDYQYRINLLKVRGQERSKTPIPPEPGTLYKTPYLVGLEALFKMYGVTKAYSFGVFSDEKEDGVVISINITDSKAGNIIGDYMDNYTEDDTMALPEQRSMCLVANKYDISLGNLIYSDGTFYSGK